MLQPTTSTQVTEPQAGEKKPARKGRRWTIWLVSLVLILVLGYSLQSLGLVPFGSRDAQATFIGPVQTEKVRKGLLRVTVNDDGNVESAANVDLKCQVQGGSQILWIIPQGTEVKEGDLLVRLNSSTIEEQITSQKILYERAVADQVLAETELAVAQIAVKEYEDGTVVKEMQTADANIVIAKENLKSSENLLRHSERMFRKGYVNRLQLETNQFAVERNKLELDAMSTARQVLVEYTKPKMLKELISKQEAAQAKVLAMKASADLEKSKLDRLNEQLAKCTITAPQAGLVIYANDRGGRSRNEASMIEEGATVREMQSLIQLPDLNYMQVNTLIHETKIDKIRPGLPATIRIRGTELLGVVKSVNNQPEPGNWFSSDVKEYAAKVTIDHPRKSNTLKPGMTAEVEILVKEIPDALQVPLLGVVQEGDENVCYLWKKENGYERRPVKVGLANTSFVEIKEGLTKDDDIILNPRACVAEAKQRAEQAALKMQKDRRSRGKEGKSFDKQASGTEQMAAKKKSLGTVAGSEEESTPRKEVPSVGGGGDSGSGHEPTTSTGQSKPKGIAKPALSTSESEK